MVESVPAGCFLGAEPGWAAANPPGNGAEAGQSRRELGEPLLRASSASAADIPWLIIPSGFQMEMLARRRGGGLAAGLSPGHAAGPPRPRDAGAEEALV